MKPFFTAIYFMPVRPAFHGSGGKISWECVIGYLAKGDFPGGYSNLPSGKPFVSILIMRDNEMGKIMTSLVPSRLFHLTVDRDASFLHPLPTGSGRICLLDT